MRTFKIVFPSGKLESGHEVIRWNPRVEDSKITMDLLIKRLREIIETPTTGYKVTWCDNENTYEIQTTEDLQHAIKHFSKQSTPVEQCVRLKAEPIDQLDIFTALELLSSEQDNSKMEERGQGTTHSSREQLDQHDEERMSTDTERAAYAQFEQARIRRIMARLQVAHQQSVTLMPTLDSGQPTKIGIQEIRDRRRNKTIGKPVEPAKPVEQTGVASVSTSTTNETGTGSDSNNTDIQTKTNSTGLDSRYLQRSETMATSSSSGKLTSDDIDMLCRKLYMMGFRFEEKTLRQTIRTYRGNINSIIDHLSQLQK